MDQQYLSIAEFADLVGVSKQAVYKRLKSADIQPYLKIVDKVKYISADAVGLFKTQKVVAADRAAPPPEQQPEPLPEQRQSEPEQPDINYLISQLAEKDKLIQQLQQIITDQLLQISKLTDNIQTQTKLQENFQILLAQQQQQLLAFSPVEQPVEQPVEPEKKKGLFHRLFK